MAGARWIVVSVSWFIFNLLTVAFNQTQKSKSRASKEQVKQ